MLNFVTKLNAVNISGCNISHSKSAIGYNVQWWNGGKLVFINPLALTAKILSIMSVIYQRCSYTNYRVLISYVQSKLEFL